MKHIIPILRWNLLYIAFFCMFYFLHMTISTTETFANIRSENHHRINVLVGRSLPTIIVKGIDVERQIYFGKVMKKYKEKIPGLKGIRFRCDEFKKIPKQSSVLYGGEFNATKSVSQKLLATVSSPTGILTWGNDKYRGDFFIVGSNTDGRCDLINRVSIENYLSTLLPKEMNANWHIEALKAQAVASRTYALYMKKEREKEKFKIDQDDNNFIYYDLENSERHQVSGHLFDENSNTAMATKLTEGEILLTSLESAKLEPIFFHAQCGGKTLNTEDVWSERMSSYKSVKCPFCDNINNIKYWEYNISSSNFYNFVRKNFSSLLNKIQDKDKNKNFDKQKFLHDTRFVPDSFERTTVNFYLNGELFTIKKAQIRKSLGQQMIYSNNFIIKKMKEHFYVKGKGRGHGVGMCQMGALFLANQGWDYKKILKHYYPNYNLVKNYGE